MSKGVWQNENVECYTFMKDNVKIENIMYLVKMNVDVQRMKGCIQYDSRKEKNNKQMPETFATVERVSLYLPWNLFTRLYIYALFNMEFVRTII